MPFGRRRFDPQPTSPAAVLLASSGSPFSRAAIRRAHELAGGEPVAVLSILKVYGSSFGLPNPGLMPTRREREEQFAIVQRAIKDLERLGGDVDGQIAATRSAGRTIAKVAGARRVNWVVMDSPNATGMRKIIEGELTGIVRRRLKGGTTLEVVGAKS
ncbi:MAG: universal stress protein [Streptosporangiaceae bacterium]